MGWLVISAIDAQHTENKILDCLCILIATASKQKIVHMKAFFFTAIALGLVAVGHAQQKHANAEKVKFTPPVIVKDETPAAKSKEAVKFTPPVIAKDKSPKSKRQKTKTTKFTPPVIVKDKEEQR